MSKLTSRLLIFSRAIPEFFRYAFRKKPVVVRRILVLHRFLLGDTIMLVPLLAKLRAKHPDAVIYFACSEGLVPIFKSCPLNVEPFAFDLRKKNTIIDLMRMRGWDLAIVPGDNRYSWAALAFGSRWIVSHSPKKKSWKDWPVDELVDWPCDPYPLEDLFQGLVDGGFEPEPHDALKWMSQSCSVYSDNVVVLHVGAGNRTRYWPEKYWFDLALKIEKLGYKPVWSTGPGEEFIVSAIDPMRRFESYAGVLSICDLFGLLKSARLLVCPDTGVAHLGKLAGVKTLCLFGPGDEGLFGTGSYFGRGYFFPVSSPILPCKNQRILFGRDLSKGGRCGRSFESCLSKVGTYSECMSSIDYDFVCNSVVDIIGGKGA